MSEVRAYNSPLREEKARSTREAIFVALFALMGSAGAPDEITTEAIAQKAGVQRRTLFRHFATKDDLLAAFWPWLNARIGVSSAPETLQGIIDGPRRTFHQFDAHEAAIRAALERAITDGTGLEMLLAVTRRDGAESLWDAGLSHVASGDTTREELLRVVDAPDATAGGGLYDSHVLRRTVTGPTAIVAGVVDVYVLRRVEDSWRFLALQRKQDTRCPGTWETVHGRIESGERPEDAAIREVREEAGLSAARLYNVTVQPFYLHIFAAVQLAVVFAAIVTDGDVVLGGEHERFEWLAPEAAIERFIWPRSKEALKTILALLAGGDAGPVEDVLRVR
jgi:8-oxo-dGTP pyrophosphatase MutT (NUDIX family)